MWVRGLKLFYIFLYCKGTKSHPMWVRGLKLKGYNEMETNRRSHPMWVRGLKPGDTTIRR